MTDKYWRQIEEVGNDIENAIQISSILLKLKGYDDKLGDLEKIGDNENNISSNSEQISTNTDNISTNSGQISNIKNDLSDFKINYSIQNLFIYNIDIENNYTLNKNNPKFSIFTYNLEDNFKSNSILEVNCKILYNYTTYNNIGTLIHIFKLYDENNELIYEYKNLKSNSGDNLSAFLNQNDLFYVELNNNYSIIKIELILSILDNITKSVSCKLLNTFKSNFLYITHYKKINTLSVNNNLTGLENDILSNLGKIENNGNNISSNLGKIDTNKNDISSNLSKIENNENNISSNLGKIDTNKNDISTNLSKIENNENNISSNLGKIDTNKNDISSNLSKIENNENNISSNLSKIDTNKNDISTNLINIKANEGNISYNLNEINYLKNNGSKSYLKNVYNVLFYDVKTQINFSNTFYEKLFDINANENDFIEMSFKISLEYENISERAYVKTFYELFDESGNSLYIKSVSNNDYSFFSNRVFLDENIFYNFTKSIEKIKFVIRFQNISFGRVINIFYIKNDNYRLTIKNYGV